MRFWYLISKTAWQATRLRLECENRSSAGSNIGFVLLLLMAFNGTTSRNIPVQILAARAGSEAAAGAQSEYQGKSFSYMICIIDVLSINI